MLLLNKLLIEQTRSRPRHSNDNGLAGSKNGAVIRKHMGFDHISAGHADNRRHAPIDYDQRIEDETRGHLLGSVKKSKQETDPQESEQSGA
jgi:hypothetical protein